MLAGNIENAWSAGTYSKMEYEVVVGRYNDDLFMLGHLRSGAGLVTDVYVPSTGIKKKHRDGWLLVLYGHLLGSRQRMVLYEQAKNRKFSIYVMEDMCST